MQKHLNLQKFLQSNFKYTFRPLNRSKEYEKNESRTKASESKHPFIWLVIFD